MKYVLLCAGEGKRMKDSGISRPKPLLLLDQETTIVRFHIKKILAQDPGAEFIIIAGEDKKLYEKEVDWLKVVQSSEGTFGALEAIKNMLTDKDKYIVLVFADNVAQFNYKGLANFAEQNDHAFAHFLRNREILVDEYVFGYKDCLTQIVPRLFTVPGVFAIKKSFLFAHVGDHTNITSVLNMFGGNFISHNGSCINVNTKEDYERAKVLYEQWKAEGIA